MDKMQSNAISVKNDVVITPSQVNNEVLKRLLEEISFENTENKLNAYNRTHNRHNRGR